MVKILLGIENRNVARDEGKKNRSILWPVAIGCQKHIGHFGMANSLTPHSNALMTCIDIDIYTCITSQLPLYWYFYSAIFNEGKEFRQTISGFTGPNQKSIFYLSMKIKNKQYIAKLHIKMVKKKAYTLKQ
jgi:hypothetical protein